MNARYAALIALDDILKGRVTLDDTRISETLEPRDRQFAWLLIRSVLRWRGFLARMRGRYLSRPLLPQDYRIEILLDLGFVQLLLLETPVHAAVSETVELAKMIDSEKHAGLLNAVLRKAAAELDAWRAEMASPSAALGALAPWLRERWQKHYGAQAALIAHASLQPAPLDLTVRTDPQGWADRLGAQLLPNGTLRLDHHASVEELPGFEEGGWWVQDAAASLPAQVLLSALGISTEAPHAKREASKPTEPSAREATSHGTSSRPIPETTIIDLCAAPGGKTAQLCASGAHVVAVDRSAPRMQRFTQNMLRLGFMPETLVLDALLYKPPAPVDAVLLDAPCSATGTMRRHPDLMWLKNVQDIAKLATLQAKLLKHAAKMLKRGGVLIYATCSLEPEEGEEQIKAFLAATPNFQRDPIRPWEAGNDAQLITPAGDIRALPHHWEGGMDGFFVARLVKM